MPLIARKDVILAKLETTVGTDAVATGAANSILVSSLNVTPMEQTLVDRDLIRQYFGNSEQLPAQLYAMVEFDIEWQSSGAAGTAPKFGSLIQACGMIETITASTRVEYDPTSTESTTKSVSIYAYKDNVLHKMLACRGTLTLTLPNQGIPRLRFRMMGQYSTPTDASPTGVVYTGFNKPVICNTTNTTPFTLHAVTPVTASLEIQLANTVVYREFIGGAKQILITDRKPAGSITMEAVNVATKDWWTTIAGATTGALAVTHGLSAGGICKINAPAVQLISPQFSEDQGVTMMQMGMILVPNTGNDELKLTFQ